MRGFGITDGDLAIVDGEILLVTGSDLKIQTIQSVLSTNKGEWLFNKDEGINFHNIFGKEVAKSSVGSMYHKEVVRVPQDDSKLSEMLEKRLSGEEYNE